MDLFELVALLLTLTAVCAYLNEQLFRLPNSIGIMLIGLLLSLGLLLTENLSADFAADLKTVFSQIDFDETVLKGMLSFLLFAGALHVNLSALAKERWVVGLLATVGVVTSTAIVGGATWVLSEQLGLGLPFIYCLIFGALISPTDPIAVLGILKRLGVRKDLETMICGESLFNDGVGVVVFLVLVGIATGSAEPSAASILELFAMEALAGAVFGLVLGLVANWLLSTVDNYHVEVLLSLAVVTGGYALASAWHLSGPIAVVVAGLLIGNHGRRQSMSETTRKRLDDFWELVDEILNAVLFLLIGIEILLLSFSSHYVLAGAISIVVVLAARFIAVGAPISVLRRGRKFPPAVVTVLTWSGLRGGISVALALSLPAGPERDPIVAMTYVVVIFSILVQGLTVGRLIKRTQG